jgi:hypothetical protein
VTVRPFISFDCISVESRSAEDLPWIAIGKRSGAEQPVQTDQTVTSLAAS